MMKYKTDYVFVKLYGRICEKYGSIVEFADVIGKSRQFVSNVLKEISFLNTNQIVEWAELLDIDGTEIYPYFFQK